MPYRCLLLVLLYIFQYVSATGYLGLCFTKFKGSTFESAVKLSSQSPYLQKRALQRDEFLQVQLTNKNDFYSVTLDIGTPAQQVTVLFDTGSSDLWFSSSQNPYCLNHETDDTDYDRRANLYEATSTISAAPDTTFMGVPIAPTIDCDQFGTFDYSNSSTFEANTSKPFRTLYADGSYALGFWGRDELYLDDEEISQLEFAVAEISNSTVGVLGVGIRQLESTFNYFNGSTYTYPNFPVILKEKGVIERIAFSLYLNSLDASTGSVLFGGVDHSKYTGDLYTVPLVNTYKSKGVPQPIQFEITVQGVGMKSKKSCQQETMSTIKFPAYLDSGATLMFMDASIVEKVAQFVNATWSDDWQFYMLDCPADNDDTKIVFDFGGLQINTPLSDYILQTDQEGLCALGIIPGDQHATFGDVFLSSVYAVYDLEQLEISLAQANYNAGSPEIDVIRSTIPGAKKMPHYSNTWEQDASDVALVTKDLFSSHMPCRTTSRTHNIPTNSSTLHKQSPFNISQTSIPHTPSGNNATITSPVEPHLSSQQPKTSKPSTEYESLTSSPFSTSNTYTITETTKSTAWESSECGSPDEFEFSYTGKMYKVSTLYPAQNISRNETGESSFAATPANVSRHSLSFITGTVVNPGTAITSSVLEVISETRPVVASGTPSATSIFTIQSLSSGFSSTPIKQDTLSGSATSIRTIKQTSAVSIELQSSGKSTDQIAAETACQSCLSQATTSSVFHSTDDLYQGSGIWTVISDSENPGKTSGSGRITGSSELVSGAQVKGTLSPSSTYYIVTQSDSGCSRRHTINCGLVATLMTFFLTVLSAL
ncbi:LAME_0G06150g1_1 [Lachancea meyersii CBS 8951]|uniref:LAME_0G06150g1_1 n=1 Tax=Lachancea meyersii CBS 8951 TaxID=1266667 RepID=A0A1G4K7J2_9SACH|nr:LAME_0G06150g1_1 [Lachancea meyersii CBS 8951]